jgi:3'-phosphoadenosine 5'-phosphosulfate sulfotransferase (PAPS reductase)/FAD synthetase
MKNNNIICWWSGGVTSAVAVWIAIQIFGKERVRIIFIDTMNESDDTYRFKNDCEKWYGLPIEYLRNTNYSSIFEVWRKFLGLNYANGAICSSELKRAVRLEFEKNNKFDFQVFGFDIDEPKRAKNMKLNYAYSDPIYPLLMFGYTKKDCLEILRFHEIDPPKMYKDGFLNNNCDKTGCVQGGIGYWQLRKVKRPDSFTEMAKLEHELTNKKGVPVTMLRVTVKGVKYPLFLEPHPKYPDLPKFSEQKGRPPKPLFECNGHCSANDGIKNDTYEELNLQNNNG